MISLKTIFTWDLNKSLYNEIDSLPLMESPGPVCMIIVIYLLFVLKVGPNFMKKREAYKLTNILVIYNAFQVVLSIYLVRNVFRLLMTTGLFPKKCYHKDSSHLGKIIFSIWLYWIAKITELMDTIFFVLRKKDKQITFLHLYHHSCMVATTWLLLKYWTSENLLFIAFSNSLIHVFMYSYYGLAALGPVFAEYLIWKKYMTQLQLVQFVSIIIHYLITLNISECPPWKAAATFVFCNTGFFLILFANFYRKSYKKHKEVRENKLRMFGEAETELNRNCSRHNATAEADKK